jgi:hypothetical protein
VEGRGKKKEGGEKYMERKRRAGWRKVKGRV